MKSFALLVGLAAAGSVTIIDDSDITVSAEWSFEGDDLIMTQTLEPKDLDSFMQQMLISTSLEILSSMPDEDKKGYAPHLNVDFTTSYEIRWNHIGGGAGPMTFESLCSQKGDEVMTNDKSCGWEELEQVSLTGDTFT